MKHDFDYELLKKDWEDFRDYIRSFFKSFGPTPTQYSAKEEFKIKWGLWKVDMGPVKIIKIIITTIVFLLMFFLIFLKAGVFFKIVTVFLFILFYAWIWMNELEDEAKNEKISLPGKAVLGIGKGVSGIFAKKEEEKKEV